MKRKCNITKRICMILAALMGVLFMMKVQMIKLR